jgi:hypothetical protein
VSALCGALVQGLVIENGATDGLVPPSEFMAASSAYLRTSSLTQREQSAQRATLRMPMTS